MMFHFQLPTPSISTLVSHIISSAVSEYDRATLDYLLVCSLLTIVFIAVACILTRYVISYTRLQMKQRLAHRVYDFLFCDESTQLNAEPEKRRAPAA